MSSTTSNLRNLTPEQFMALRRPSRIAPREGGQELLPLSWSQERLWFLAQMEGGSEAYHLPVGFRLAGKVDAAGLEWALQRIVARHEALRTCFTAVGGEAFQQIEAQAVFRLRREDVRGAPERLPQLLSSVVQERFDMEHGPLLRGCLVRVGDDEHVLVLVLHHIVSDGWSVGILMRELCALYAAHCAGKGDDLPPLALQYGDYAVWQRRWLSSSALAKHADYWRERLSGAPQLLRLPADRKRPAKQDYSGASIEVTLDAGLTGKLKALSLRQGTSLFMTIMAAWALVLSRLSGQQDLVIGTPTANRARTELEGLIGFFVNTLALRIDLSGGLSVAQLLERVKGVALEAQEHQDLPFEQVVELLNPARSLSHTPLFQVMFAWQNTQEDALALLGLQAHPIGVGSQAAKFDLTLDLTERAGGIVGVLNYATALFDHGTAQRHVQYLLATLAQFAADPRQQADAIDLLPEDERRKVLYDWNATRHAPASTGNLVQLFEACATATPDHDALEYEGERLSYRALNEAANRLAHELRDRGVGPDQRVALCLERSPEMVIAVLAVLKAGGCYVPLDPAYPQQRISTMLVDAAPKLLLTQERLCGNLPTSDVPMLRLDADRDAWSNRPAGNPAVAIHPDNLIYVIYTSGSTGRPKGVAQTWGALGNLVDWQNNHAAPGSPRPERVLQFASLSFDVSFQEIFSTLCSGNTLVLLSETRRKELGELRAFIAERDIRRAFLPNAVLQQIVDFSSSEDAPGQCEVVTAGEALQVNDALRRCMRMLGGSYLYNHYGPTEAHAASQHALACADADHWPSVPPIGRPISNAQIYLLDAALQPVPVGVTGELYICGAGLARGYLNRPELTAERFLPNPFADTPGERMYRTGDAARWLQDGNIDFTGRIDDQVKIRGFRIEPGEIETLLQQQPEVREAAVLVREDTPGDRRLVAYVAGTADTQALRARLQQQLPEHMVPTHWVALERLPLTANGKVNRRALPAPTQAASGAEFVAPRTEREARMAQIWATVLKVERVGAFDNFFALGGHSLLATRLVHATNQQMQGRLTLSMLFQHPVLADLAAASAEASQDDKGEAFDTIRPDAAARWQPFPLTDIQQAYWVGREATAQLGGVAAHAYEELRIPNFDAARFTRALNRLIARHDMLRAVFHSDGTQQVLETVPPYAMPCQDLRGHDPATAERLLAELREAMSHEMRDASRWPLFDFRVTLLDGGVTHLHIGTDALIVDAASTQILGRELIRLYADPQAELPPLGVAFRDYVLAERALRATPRYARALAYWRERLDDLAPAPQLPLAQQPEAIAAPRFTRHEATLPAAQWSALRAAARNASVTPSILLLTAFSEILALWSRHPRFTVNLTLFNRLPLHPDIHRVIGDFTSLVLLEVKIDPEASFAQQAHAVQAQLWRDMDHAAVGGVQVLRELSQARGVQQTAMPVVFNSTLADGSGAADISLGDALGAEAVHTITQTPQVWLDHTVLESEGRLIFNWDSIEGLFPDGMVNAMFDAYCSLLDQLAQPAAWQSPLSTLLPWTRLAPAPALPALPEPQLIHELFDRQALATPDAPAVIAAGRRIAYGQLRREALHWGARLQSLGAAPNQLVAVVMERGWEQVVATLAVLYAGAAYLPLDPALPAARMAQILEAAQARLVLTQKRLLRRLALPAFVEAIAIDEAGAGDETPQPAATLATDLAYVIYTSGSSGTPKGVMIDHRGAVNTLRDINERFTLTPADRVLAISSLSFDLSVFDLFGTLAAGAAVVMLDPDAALDPAQWHALVETHRVSIWNSVPALLGMLAEYAESAGLRLPGSLRLAMLSGDWIPVGLPARVRALAPAMEIISLGGATEASIWSIWFPIKEVDPAWRSIPYGRALRNQRMLVLDDAMRPRPAWVPGQICIGGIGLAQGYWGDAQQTARSFVTHPETGERLYRTGDLGRYLPSGDIEFLGREDGQVKVQGFRIELGEIETALEQHPDVRHAVVRALGTAQGEKRLAAYVVAERPGLDAAALQRHLASRLPAYMVPASFTFLPALPLSANGKVDRARLPEPASEAAPLAQLAVTGAEEQRLVEIVQEILKQDALALDANLLSLGATSIDVVRIANALARELGFRPALAQLFMEPTLVNLIGLYREHRRQGEIAQAAQQASRDPGADETIDDPQQRKDFKARALGLRVFAEDQRALSLPRADLDARFASQRSVRHFRPDTVSPQALAGLLAVLSQGTVDGQPKYLYPSAGGLYPVQAYLYVKPDRVDGIAAGAYYHDPRQHRLVAVGGGRVLGADAYDYFVNRPIFEQAAFALFLVAELAAIRPLYGAQSMDLCHIEAGAMAQLLATTAIERKLGLCGIGSVDLQQVEPLLELGPTHRMVYSMLGGIPAEGRAASGQVEVFASRPDPAPAETTEAAEMEEFKV
ncbi:MAG: amino acid adenylation domain-containing protein [Pseudomonadota bacterium]